jgi:hypothetical protein
MHEEIYSGVAVKRKGEGCKTGAWGELGGNELI